MRIQREIKPVPSLGEPVGKLWQSLQAEYTSKGYFNVAAPLSSTPLPIYDWIIQHKDSFSGWDKVRFVLMDEMVDGDKQSFHYISTDDFASYERFAHHHFLDPLRENVPVLKPKLPQVTDVPSIDLLMLAVSVKGNYANVMPGTELETGWHIARLIPEFRQAHTRKSSKSYAGAAFREYGMSLGPQQVLHTKHVVVIISGRAKAALARELLSYKDFDPVYPLSIVHHKLVRDRVRFYITDDVFGTT